MKSMIQCMAMALSLFTHAAWACSCAPPGDLETDVPRALKYADAVFLGQVIALEKDTAREFETYETTQFAVKSVWKGALEDTVSTRVMTTCCLCGFQFTVGQTYLVYAKQRANGDYHVSRCSRTKTAEQAEAEIQRLQVGF